MIARLRFVPRLTPAARVATIAILSVAAAPAVASATSLSAHSGPGGALGALAVVPSTVLTDPSGAAAEQFGAALAFDGNTAVVGAPKKTVDGTTEQGAAFVFVRSGSSWIQQAMLAADDGAASDLFGAAVDIEGDTLVVGAPGHGGLGAVCVFVRSGTTWTQQADIPGFGFTFGSAVAVSNGTLVVGAKTEPNGPPNAWPTGAAYVFSYNGTTWTQQARLLASDGGANDLFGAAVDVRSDGIVVVVGAPGNQAGAGAAYTFLSLGTPWTQDGKMVASDAAAGDAFGTSLAMDGSTIAAGAPGHTGQGAVYVFLGWQQLVELTGAQGAAGDMIGASVDLVDTGIMDDPPSASTVVAGAPGHGEGCAFIFNTGTYSMTGWNEQPIVTASDGVVGDAFGSSVAIAGPTLLVGTPMRATGQGAVCALGIKPGVPVLKSPKGLIKSRTPWLKWKAAAGAKTYQVRIYKGSRLLKSKIGLTYPWWKCTMRLPRDVWLTWKARAVTGGGTGAWSGKLRFQVR